ncbi:MAG: ferritin-like domain-containing protein [Alphaproteobacteria bacterium]|nr:ferritin-like domain-containing protein [Alphaproteobacteria bacterium]
MTTLCEAALIVLNTVDAQEKCRLTRDFYVRWQGGEIAKIGLASPPDRPARPDKPALLLPTQMPKRGGGGNASNKTALLHALAHIELNAVDLAWDILARFSPLAQENGGNEDGFALPKAFYDDWIKVAEDEAKHHMMIEERLNALGASYGDLPAHDGLWEASEKTAHDFPARLAIVPMVLEARGLDVTPNMIAAMKEQGDGETAQMLQVIHDDEITHVRAGTVWFESWCAHYGLDVETHFQSLVRAYFSGLLKRPFNHPSRAQAGMIRDWYEPLAEALKSA